MENSRIGMLRVIFTAFMLVPGVALAQYWSKVDISTRDGLQLRLKISGANDCLEELKISFEGKPIVVPREAVKDVCHVLLEDIKVFPDETLINLNHVATGWVVSLPMFPPGKPNEIISDERLPKYEIGFNEECVNIRLLERWDDLKSMMTTESAGHWSCSDQRGQDQRGQSH